MQCDSHSFVVLAPLIQAAHLRSLGVAPPSTCRSYIDEYSMIHDDLGVFDFFRFLPVSFSIVLSVVGFGSLLQW